MHLIWRILCLVFAFGCYLSHAALPNIVFVLTDDEDVILKTPDAMPKTKQLIGDSGIIFENMFVTSPLCCPSRSSILTGRYVHNHGAVNNSLSGNCSSTLWQKGSEVKAFPTFLKKQGYTTFFAGKYLNQYGDTESGGLSHVPPGWDHWNGLQYNSRYYNYSLSINGKEEKHGDDYKKDYLTDVIHSKAQEFLLNPRLHTSPFFMMLSTPACHAPFTPAPQYSTKFPNLTAPRNGSFNYHGKDKHWIIRNAKNPLSKVSLDYIDNTYRNRWRTLQSVDDMVEGVYNRLKSMGVLEETYIIFSSDNGFHLGQFSLPNDKRQLYDFDIRVPLMVRGPGIKAGQVRQETLLNIDLAPTFVDLAQGPVPSQMDGISFKSLLNASQRTDLHSDFIVEHQGEYDKKHPGCPQYDNQPLNNCYPDCVCEDSTNNTYTCIRRLSPTQNLVYCGFEDSEMFTEAYDLNSDPHQLVNSISTMDKQVLASLSRSLGQLAACSGPSCRILP